MARSRVDWTLRRASGGMVAPFSFSDDESEGLVTQHGLLAEEVLSIQPGLETAIFGAGCQKEESRLTAKELNLACSELEEKVNEVADILRAGGFGGAAPWIDEYFMKRRDFSFAGRRREIARQLCELGYAAHSAKERIAEDVSRVDRRQGVGSWRAALIRDIALTLTDKTTATPSGNYSPDTGSIGVLGYLYDICLDRMGEVVQAQTIKGDLAKGLELLNN